MELYLIRHAQSANNARPEEERVEDPGLTSLGEEQARRLAAWIPQLRLSRLFTSPFRRTLETTEPLRRATGLTPEVRIQLHEQGGCYHGYGDRISGRPGLTRAQIEAEFPGFDIEPALDGQGWWRSQPYESFDQARQRAAALLQWAIAEFAGTHERAALVMHADIKMLLLQQITAELVAVPYNTAVTRLRITSSGVVVEDFNRTTHLSESLISF